MTTGPAVVVAAVAVDDGCLLVVRRGPCWGLPSAVLEAGEALAVAVVRAVDEEAGLAAVSDGLLGVAERVADDGHVVVLAHRAAVLDAAPPRPGPGVADARWEPLETAAELALDDGLPELLADAGVLDLLT